MRNNLRSFTTIAAFAIAAVSGVSNVRAQTAAAPAENVTEFAPVQQWKQAVVSRDEVALKGLYSAAPAAQVRANETDITSDIDAAFWSGLKAKSVKLTIVRERTKRPGEHDLIVQAEVESEAAGKTVLVAEDQVWQQEGADWRLVYVNRTDGPSLKQPSDMKKDIYPADADARAELAEAQKAAAGDHKRVLLVFGANWCYDCHVLDLAFRRPDLAPVLAAGYEVVHVDLGPDEHKNADLVKQYEVPLNKGIPALAVVDSDGKLIVSQKNGEFENARAITPEDLLAFLNKWAGTSR
jgi:thioredoxin 1